MAPLIGKSLFFLKFLNTPLETAKAACKLGGLISGSEFTKRAVYTISKVKLPCQGAHFMINALAWAGYYPAKHPQQPSSLEKWAMGALYVIKKGCRAVKWFERIKVIHLRQPWSEGIKGLGAVSGLARALINLREGLGSVRGAPRGLKLLHSGVKLIRASLSVYSQLIGNKRAMYYIKPLQVGIDLALGAHVLFIRFKAIREKGSEIGFTSAK